MGIGNRQTVEEPNQTAAEQGTESTEGYLREKTNELFAAELATAASDEVRRDSVIEGKMKLLQEAAHFLYGEQGIDQMPWTLTESQWESVRELADEIEAVNGMEWHEVDHGQHLRAKRPDGTEVYVPGRYFPRSKHTMDLREVVVNTKDGYTIHDALRAIIGKGHSPRATELGREGK